MYTKEAVNSLRANPVMLKLAKALGKKFTVTEGNANITLSEYRGKVYLIGFEMLCQTCNKPHEKTYGENNEWCENCVPY